MSERYDPNAAGAPTALEERDGGDAGGPAAPVGQVRPQPAVGPTTDHVEPRTDFAPTRPATPPAAAGAQPHVPAPRPAGRKRRVRKLVLALVALVAVAGGSTEGWRWWTVGRFMVGTDDAYVAADTTVLAAKVAGYVTDVTVEDNQHVRAGDLIARIDDGDYRLAVEADQNRIATQQ